MAIVNIFEKLLNRCYNWTPLYSIVNLINSLWYMYASVNEEAFALDNGLSPVRR